MKHWSVYDWMFAVGYLALVGGICMVSVPAGMMVGGIILMALGALGASGIGRRRKA